MRLSKTHRSPVAGVVAILIELAAAHPHGKTSPLACDIDRTQDLASEVLCGQPSLVKDCFLSVDLEAPSVRTCLVDAGCTSEQAKDEVAWAMERCQIGREAVGGTAEVVIELRQLQGRDTTTTASSDSSTSTATETTSASATTTSSSTSATTTDSTTSTSSSDSTASTTASSTTESSSSTSSTSSTSTTSTTSTSTASTTSSASSSTSTSDSSSSSDEFPAMGYVVAVIMGSFALICLSGICYSCNKDRSRRKAAARLAEEKQSLTAAGLRG